MIRDVHNWLIDHASIGVSDIARSTRFYEAALRPLGIEVLACVGAEMHTVDRESPEISGVAFGVDYPVFWIDRLHPSGVARHTAFRAVRREQVDAFHREGLSAGGRNNGAPGLRIERHPPGYYAAFLLDPDGHNVEAVCREGDGR